MSVITPFTVDVPQADLDDLRQRLDRVRWPEAETEAGWGQGVPLEAMRDLVDHWRDGYDWRRCEAELNRHDQFTVEIDGLPIYLQHIRSPHADAFPLILTHGWPGSILEFRHVVEPLTNPTAHGGLAADAFHLVIPSLPGYGFSGKPTGPGWGVDRIASTWGRLMRLLGYDRYGAQGGDWGSTVTLHMGAQRLEGLAGIHLNMLSIRPKGAASETASKTERAAIDASEHFASVESAYARLQATRPQTLGYSLADSPTGQAAWIYEKLRAWSDCDGDPLSIFAIDDVLDGFSLYWLTNSGASSARLYRESFNRFGPIKVALPLGYSHFPKEILKPPRAWADEVFSNIVYWNDVDKGGHFAAFEQPALFVDEVRACFRVIR